MADMFIVVTYVLSLSTEHLLFSDRSQEVRLYRYCALLGVYLTRLVWEPDTVITAPIRFFACFNV